MALLETLIIELGPAIAKGLMYVWVRDTNFAADAFADVAALIQHTTKDRIAQVRGSRQFEIIGGRIAEDIYPLFQKEVRMPEEDCEAVVMALADTFRRIKLGSDLLVAKNLNPDLLSQYVLAQGEKEVRHLSETQAAVYRRLVPACMGRICDEVRRFPRYSESTAAEMLRRADVLIGLSEANLQETKLVHEDAHAIRNVLEDVFTPETRSLIEKTEVRSRYISLPERKQPVGRQREIKLMVDSIQSTTTVTAAVGVGGVGKTTIALEAVHICLEQGKVEQAKQFDIVVWATAKDQELIIGADSTYVTRRRPDIETLEDIYDKIADVAGVALTGKDVAEKEKYVLQLLRTNKCLVVIDNFDTLRDGDQVVEFLKDIPNQSRFVVTSRRSVGIGYVVSIEGMEEQDARDFVRVVNAGRKRPLQSISSSVSDDLIDRLADWCGRIPLAMMLTLRQVGSESELDRLLQVDVRSPALLEFCFGNSYEKLGPNSRLLLYSISMFNAPKPSKRMVSREKIAAVTRLYTGVLDREVEMLADKLLLDIVYGTDGNEGYQVLPLVRSYVRSRFYHENLHDAEGVFNQIVQYYSEFVARNERHFEKLEPELDDILVTLEECISKQRDVSVVSIAPHITQYLGILARDQERERYARLVMDIATRLGNHELAEWVEVFDINWILLNGNSENQRKASSRYWDMINTSSSKRVKALSYRDLALMKRKEYEGELAKRGIGEANRDLLLESKELAQLSLKLWEELQDRYWEAVTRGVLGSVAILQGDYGEAERQFRTALAIDQASNNLEGIALAISNLGKVAIKQDRHDVAAEMIEKALQIDLQLERPQGIAAGYQRMAYVQDRLGDVDKALMLLEQARQYYIKIGNIHRAGKVKDEIELLKLKKVGKRSEFLF